MFRNLIAKFFLIWGGIVTGLLLIEAVLQLTALGLKKPAEFIVETGPIYQYNPLLGWNLTPHAESRVKNSEYDVIYRINAQGFRDDHDYSLAKQDKRIVFLGDSFAFGLGVPNRKSIPKQLEEKSGCEVLNMGITGYSPSQYLLLLENAGLHYDPDVAIVSIYTGNDVYDTGLAEKTTGLKRNKPYFELVGGQLALEGVPVPEEREFFDGVSNKYLKNSKLYNTAKWFTKLKIFNLVKNFLRDEAYPFGEKLGIFRSIEDYENNLQIIGAALERAKTSLENLGGERVLIVAIMPGYNIENDYLQKAFISRLASILESKKINFINILSEMENLKNYYFPLDMHFNQEGSGLVAEKLHEKLQPLVQCR